MLFWPRETAILLKSNLLYFHREKSTFEKFDAGLKLRIVFYTHKTIKNRRKNFRVIYTLNYLNTLAHGLYFSSLFSKDSIRSRGESTPDFKCRIDWGQKSKPKKIPRASNKTPKKSLDQKLSPKNPMPNFRALKISRD